MITHCQHQIIRLPPKGVDGIFFNLGLILHAWVCKLAQVGVKTWLQQLQFNSLGEL